MTETLVKPEMTGKSPSLPKHITLIHDLAGQVAELRTEIRSLKDEVAELKEELNKRPTEADIKGLRTSIDVVRVQMPTGDAIKAYTLQLREVQGWMVQLIEASTKKFRRVHKWLKWLSSDEIPEFLKDEEEAV